MSNITNNVLEQKNERVTSYFGANRTITLQGTTINGHSGIDFVPEGWIITPEDGEVISVKDSVAGVSVGTGNDFGNYVHLRVNPRYVLRFCHLKQGAIVKVGQKLKKGARVGYMGTTGFSTGIHLHFEIRDNNIAIDPLPYLEGKLKLTATTAQVPPVTEPPPPANTSRYVVVAGDTMTKIAEKFKLQLGALAAANPAIKDINKINVGQVINIPNIPPTLVVPTPPQKSAQQVASEIWRGQGGWGNDPGRKEKLIAYGGAAFREEVQQLLNKM